MSTEINFLIHGALWREVSDTLARLKLRPLKEDEVVGRYHLSAQWKYYEGDVNTKRVGLLISGIGRRRTRQALKWIQRFRTPKHVISIGTAGALNPELPLGELRMAPWVASLSNMHSEGKLFLDVPDTLKHLSCGGLMTAATPVLREKVREQIRESTGADLVDMEGVAVARFGRKHEYPVTIVKVLTDHSDEGAVREYSHQVTSASQMLSKFCYDIILDSHRIWPNL
jgi:nucleoside phosphorylase